MSANGIHHVTAIAGPARRNLDFYTRVLGLRLVKKTVNFDDPETYHLYYGDEFGRPGTILTFFPWEHVAPGRIGVGETSETAFKVPLSSIGWWTHRFVAEGVAHEAPTKVFGETVLPFRDPDGMHLALIGVTDPPRLAWPEGGISAEHAILGFHGVTLMLRDVAPTGAILSDIFGFAEIGREGSLLRFDSGAAQGGIVQLRGVGDFLQGRPGGGSVHHVAFRAADDAAQAGMVERLAAGHGVVTTEQKDRSYFRSVYFREPGGVLFEIATDIPGFSVDEAPDALGRALKLPLGLEPRRAQIKAALPEIA
ncbi:ring-cleaving dioxygenase [uncultured Enterovirga sp.]|uniref:ring-cleaving dioxygenase n=1 Tax=uncultured Enterovirga sp. TaxID=2026352 RepID=UPI0035CACA93